MEYHRYTDQEVAVKLRQGLNQHPPGILPTIVAGPESIIYHGPGPITRQGKELTCLPLAIGNTIVALGLDVELFLMSRLLNRAQYDKGFSTQSLEIPFDILTQHGFQATYTDLGVIKPAFTPEEDLLLRCQNVTSLIREQLEQRVPLIVLVTGHYSGRQNTENAIRIEHATCVVGYHDFPNDGPKLQVLEPYGDNPWVPDWLIGQSAAGMIKIIPQGNPPRRDWYQEPIN